MYSVLIESILNDHYLLALLDPQWIQRRQKEMAEQQEKEQVFEPGTNQTLPFILFDKKIRCSGSSIETELKKMAERRTDIFGTGAQETLIGRKV